MHFYFCSEYILSNWFNVFKSVLSLNSIETLKLHCLCVYIFAEKKYFRWISLFFFLQKSLSFDSDYIVRNKKNEIDDKNILFEFFFVHISNLIFSHSENSYFVFNFFAGKEDEVEKNFYNCSFDEWRLFKLR